jgi:hypothetical protein
MVGGTGARLVAGGVGCGLTCEGRRAGCGASMPASGKLAVGEMVGGAGTRLGLPGRIVGGEQPGCGEGIQESSPVLLEDVCSGDS